MARAIDKLNKAGKEFYAAVRPLSNGQDVDPKEVRGKYLAIGKLIKDTKAKYEDIGPPMGTDWGEEMLSKFVDFIDGQQTIFDKYLTPVVQTVEDNQLDAAGKWDKIKPLLDGVDKEEAQQRGPLEDVQKKWAEEHKLDLKK
jgi:hypothetical protein